MLLKDTLRYELPPQGTTLLGYIVRRMHKTAWLAPVRGWISAGESEQALANIGLYTVAASTSFGRAFYQPRFDSVGDEVSAADPTTGALVTARLDSASPHYLISYSVKMPDGSSFEGNEEITGTTIGLRGLGMPAPSKFQFRCAEYSAKISGTLTSELVLSLIGKTRIRAYGFLNLADSDGNEGKVRIERTGQVQVEVNGKDIEPVSTAAVAA